VSVAVLAAACEGDGPAGAGEGEGEGEEPPCFIGDGDAAAEIELVFRTLEGAVADVIDGGDVPLILPPQGGKVTLIGVRAKNVTCRALLNAGLLDECQDPPRVIGREGRPIELVESDDGFGRPRFPETLQNYANIPVCPNFASATDGDQQPYRLEVRVTEDSRAGEDERRTHVLEATVTPTCAEPELEDACRCECDADFSLELGEEQCLTIHDNDTPGQCPVGEGEGE
jgi:hypothetical protein